MTTVVAFSRGAAFAGLSAVRADEPMGRHTSFRVGGPAEFYVHVRSEGHLAQVARLAREAGGMATFTGSGSNLLVSDAGVPGLVVETRNNDQPLAGATARALADGRVAYWVYSGVPLPRLAAAAAGLDLSGFEWATGIPGTVGGGVVNNAGAHGSDMAGTVVAARIWTPAGIMEVPSLELDFGYRASGLRRPGSSLWGAVVLAVEVAFTPGRRTEIATRIAEFTAYRRATQPRESSVGSIFKNPPGEAAGRLLERAGVKGLRCGDAQVSTKHANFIVNRGRASATEVVNLIGRSREAVLRECGVALELEIQLLGRWGEGETP